ncbi:hypothetical protein BGZ72_010259 [Mortierella alpina]|nr:hypothetical protein BGZ72_010259 [Mortierella alpina]
MENTEDVRDAAEQTQPSTLAPPPAAPVRRRSKLACDTCHYRKIKCDVEKGHPCKNCEKSAVQCTLVGPSMRPPRNISGSSSAAARAAVAVAVATAAAASAHSAPAKGFGTQNTEEDPTGDCNMAWSTESPQTCEASTEQGSSDIRIPGLLVRRASASGQLMRPDEDPASSDDTKVKRGLLSSSSSPTSLRALFNAGASASSSSSAATPSHPGSQAVATSAASTSASGENSGSTAAGAHMDLNIGGTGFDYFDHPNAFSSGSSTTSSTPSSAVLANGLAHFTYPIDTISSTVAHLLSPLSSPLCLAQSSSLPPTPMHVLADRLPESVMAGVSNSVGNTGRYSAGYSQFHPPAPHSRHTTPRRASSSSFLPSQVSADNDIRIQQHDRRTSAPWVGYTHPHTLPHTQSTPYESRHAGAAGAGGVHGQPYSTNAIHVKKHYATTDDIHPYPPSQSALMRSNSTPAALRSPLKSLNRNRHSALPSRRSHIGPTRHSVNLYASTDKIIQDLSLPQQLYRHSALPQRHNNSISHLQFQLHLQQLQHSQQNTQRSQSLPRFQREPSHRPSLQHPQQQWPGFSAHQDADHQFDVASSSAHSVVSDLAISPAALSANEPDGSLDIRTAEILSPLSIHSPIQADTSEFQSFASQMTTAYDPTLTEDVGSTSGIGALVQNELEAQQQQEHQARVLPGEGQTAAKLQFSDGYAWRQDEVANQGAHGHTRHQSASLVYPQQQSLQFGTSSSSSSSSAQHRSYLTRSLQDLTHYSATVNDQQQRLAEQVRRLQEDTVGTQPPQSLDPPTTAQPQDQGVAQDMFGASLALVLDDHLRLLDDMDVVPELNEYEEMSQPSMVAPSQVGKSCLLMSAGPSLHSDSQEMGSPTVGTISQEASISIFDAIARSASNAQDAMFLGGGDESFKDLSGGMMHFQTEPYIDTLSFLDLSGTYVPPTATTPTAFTSTITSSSLPNTSFLDQQSTRLYHGLLPNLQQHSPAQGLGANSMNNTLDQQVLSRAPPQVPQQPQQLQQHIVHHQHHHHHHVHLH